jgi:4-amino-4-deoxy-L-arabinose transferase-like glycosyltransferase
MPGLIATIERRPRAAFAAFLALHFAVWTALPSLLYPNLPLDLIEALTYGREWQLGYDKLPPLPWWLVEIVYRTIGQDWAYYALAQVAVIAALALIFAIARPLVGAAGALVAVLIVDGLHYLNYTAAKFNHDVIQLPLWALAGYAFHAALRRGRLADWALLGLAIGGALWAKYFVIVLAAPLALFLLADRDARPSLLTAGPWLALAVALIAMAPHLVWLVQNDFLPFAYADARAVKPRGLFDHLLHPAAFAVGQFVFMLPALLIALPLFRPTRQAPVAATADAFDRRIVALLAFGPFAALVAMMLLTGRGAVAMWGYPLWLFLGLWLVLKARAAIDRLRLAWIVALWAAVFVLLAAAFVVNYAVLPRYDHRYRAVFFPGDKLAAELTAKFRALTGRPLAYVVGSMWDGGNVAHYSADHPRVLIDGNARRAPWIDLGDFLARGAVVVWTDGDRRTLPIPYRGVAVDAEVQEPFVLANRRGDGTVEVGWAVLRPRAVYAGHRAVSAPRE